MRIAYLEFEWNDGTVELVVVPDDMSYGNGLEIFLFQCRPDIWHKYCTVGTIYE